MPALTKLFEKKDLEDEYLSSFQIVLIIIIPSYSDIWHRFSTNCLRLITRATAFPITNCVYTR